MTTHTLLEYMATQSGVESDYLDTIEKKLIERIISDITYIQKHGVDLDEVPENMRGILAKESWNDATFKLGAEYGAIAILMNIFDITEEELKDENTSRLLHVEKYITPVVHSKAMAKITGL